LFSPTEFEADTLSDDGFDRTIWADVTRDGEGAPISDWFSVCELDKYSFGDVQFVGLFYDTSGSMTLSTAAGSLAKFKDDLSAAGLTYMEVFDSNEGWITPFITSLVPSGATTTTTMAADIFTSTISSGSIGTTTASTTTPADKNTTEATTTLAADTSTSTTSGGSIGTTTASTTMPPDTTTTEATTMTTTSPQTTTSTTRTITTTPQTTTGTTGTTTTTPQTTTSTTRAITMTPQTTTSTTGTTAMTPQTTTSTTRTITTMPQTTTSTTGTTTTASRTTMSTTGTTTTMPHTTTSTTETTTTMPRMTTSTTGTTTTTPQSTTTTTEATMTTKATTIEFILALFTGAITAGDSIKILPIVKDGEGNLVEPLPAIVYEITVSGEATGTLPVESLGAISTFADTRGVFTVSGTVDGTSVTATEDFAVFRPAAELEQMLLYSELSTPVNGVSRGVSVLIEALSNNDIPVIQSELDALHENRDSVDLVAMHSSTLFAPEGGFLPTPSDLAASGFPATADDVSLQGLLKNIAQNVKRVL